MSRAVAGGLRRSSAAVTQAACPFGAYDRRVLRSLRGYGYERVFTSDGGRLRADRWLQARNSVIKATTAGRWHGFPH